MSAALLSGAASLLLSRQSAPLFRRIVRWGTGGVNIREASTADLKTVQRILNFGAPHDIRQQDPTWASLLTVRGERFVGSVDLVRHSPEDSPFIGYWLSSLVVFHLRDRGLGIGESFTRALIAISRKKRAPVLHLVVYGDNIPAIRLYEKCGFVRTIIPGLEEELENGINENNRRRIAMVKPFND